MPRAFHQCQQRRAYDLKAPHLGWLGWLMPWSALSLWACLSLLQGGLGVREQPCGWMGHSFYLRLYCVCIPGAFRAWHKHPTPQSHERASIQTSQDFLADEVQPGDLILVAEGQNPSRTSSLPTPSPLSPRPGRLQAQQQRLERVWKDWKKKRRFGHRLVGGCGAVRFLELPE